MQSFKGRFEPTRFEDLTVTVDFHCHSACRFCIVQEGLNRYRGVPFERYKRAVDENTAAPRYRRVTFTGGEVTLEKRLFDYLDYAREHGVFEHVRLQTNARPLADMAFAKRLVAAGVDEFFVSLHGPDAATQDYISQREGSFDEAWRGLENLKALGQTVMTNTVLTTLNVEHLTAIVERVAPLEPARMEWWNYLPMEDKADELGLIVPMAELAPALVSALDAAKAHGIECAVKYMPICLLGEHEHTIDNAQPDVVIVEEFYDMYPKFACLWEAKCEHAEACLGLSHAYIHKYGWDPDLLVAVPRTRPWEEQVDGLAYGTDHVHGEQGGRGQPRREAHPEWRFLVEGVAEANGAELESVMLDRRRCTFRFVAAGARVDLVLTKRSDSNPALLRTRSFNVSYRDLRIPEGAEAARPVLTKVVEAAARAVEANDRGAMLLDERKGLIGAEALRRPKG